MTTTSKRKGFTLIELLIVVVVIGILAAIAIPKFSYAKFKANFAAMKSDLTNLILAEENYVYSHQTYTADLDSLIFQHSPGVVLTITEATVTGWSAVSTHPASAPHRCAYVSGTAALVTPATVNGAIACD